MLSFIYQYILLCFSFLSLIFYVGHAIGLCSTNNSPAMEWIKAQYGSNVVNSATLALTNSSISWSQALFPFGPDIHETLRTTNGINFKDAAKETVAVQLTTLPTLDIIQSKADGFEGLGAVVWQCGLVLCHFFDTNVGGEGKKMIQNQNVYDLVLFLYFHSKVVFSLVLLFL